MRSHAFPQMTKQMDVFKKNLEEFAAKHKEDIRKDPQFRLQFQDMCASIGVDPLACEYGSMSCLPVSKKKKIKQCEINMTEHTCAVCTTRCAQT